MKSHVQAAVIGGGVVGASVLYHLTKAGWKDVALFERSELTSGSTWHAAGGMHTLNGDPDVSALQRYTIDLYREIEEISGQSCGVHLTGGVILADTPDRMDWLKTARAIGRYMNLDTELVTPQEARELFPLIDPACFVGGLYDPCGRPCRSVGRDPGLREIGADRRRGDLSSDQGRGFAAETGRQLGRRDREGHGPCRARRQCRRPVGARGRPHGRRGTAGARHGAHVSADRRNSGSYRFQRIDRPPDDARPRFRRRDLHPPGRQGHADRHLRSAPASPGRRKRRPGTSATNCWRPTSIGLRRRWKSASSIFRPTAARESSRSSTALSPSRRTATRWSGRFAA